MKALKNAYTRFHGHGSREKRTCNFTVPKGLIILGEAVAIEYRSDKLNGGGDGTKAVYRHQFNKGAFVCADEKMKRQLYILGSKIVVTKAGIEH